MTQFLMGLNAALMALQAGVVVLTALDDSIKAVIVLACSVAIAFLGPFLPSVSAATRRILGLRRTG